MYNMFIQFVFQNNYFPHVVCEKAQGMHKIKNPHKQIININKKHKKIKIINI